MSSPGSFEQTLEAGHLYFGLDGARALACLGLEEQAVSQQNVQVARRAMDAFNSRDLDAFTASMTSDIEWFPTLERGFGGGYRGLEGVASYFTNLRATW